MMHNNANAQLNLSVTCSLYIYRYNISLKNKNKNRGYLTLRTLSLQTGVVKERLVQLQRCMHSLQETGGAWSHGGQESNSLGAILALMAAVLTECDLHCHSQALGVMAKRLGE